MAMLSGVVQENMRKASLEQMIGAEEGWHSGVQVFI
jgi:hypothetical protein